MNRDLADFFAFNSGAVQLHSRPIEIGNLRVADDGRGVRQEMAFKRWLAEKVAEEIHALQANAEPLTDSGKGRVNG